jgi:FkbH-like protein
MNESLQSYQNKRTNPKAVKCVVWDLDNTLWAGVLLENDNVSLRDHVVDIIRTLDSRGILQSIASKNEYVPAIKKVQELGLHEYFLYPQIGWDSKASSIETIARLIDIGLDTVAFIDDEAFEREEVKFSHPEVLCLDALHLDQLLEMPEMNPRSITEESKIRRLMYINEEDRKTAEHEFSGTHEDFLSTLNMVCTISSAKENDLKRAEELTLRTNQLNTTGYTYSYDELNSFSHDDRYQLLIASLDDKFGTYGKIGLALVACHPSTWTIKLLLMSCRVMSRGVGTVMISHIMKSAKQKGVRLEAEFVPNDRNRMMYVTYKFAGFKEKTKDEKIIILESDLSHIHPFPTYMEVRATV